MTKEEQRAAAIAEARSWLGTPFRMGQASKGYGVDCGLFLAACYRAAGFELPSDFGLFRSDWHLHTKEERYLAVMERYLLRVDAPAPGDIVLFRLKPHQPFAHAALVINWTRSIHATHRGGVCEFDAARGYPALWEQRFFSPWHPDELTN